MGHVWKNTLLLPNKTIADAIQVLELESLRVALVVDADNHLLGVITDGDIRRGLLRKISLEEPVSKIMNTSPKIVSINDDKSNILSIMKEYDLLQIPIVDNGKIVGLETLQNLITTQLKDNPVFLMAGGFGKRLQPLTHSCPKPLLKVGKKPILETILESFIESGFHNFYISTHFLSEKIREYFGDGSDWGVNISYIHEDTPLGTGGALGLLPDNMPDLPLIMMNGDVLTKIDINGLLTYHNEQNSIATMCVREYEHQIPYGVIESDGPNIVSITEKPKYNFFINAGIYVINRSIINNIQKNTKIDMPTLLEDCISNNHTVSMFPIHEYWKDIGIITDFEQAQADFKLKFDD